MIFLNREFKTEIYALAFEEAWRCKVFAKDKISTYIASRVANQLKKF